MFKKMHKRSLGLNLCLTLFIFLLTTATMIITAGLFALLLRFRIIEESFFRYPLANLFCFLAILSVLISTCICMFFSHFPLRPIRRIIKATDELAKGNFDTRIHFEFPPELQNLSESFNSLASELEHNTMLKNDFINNFSHEFKTPIVSIKGFAKLVQDEDLSEEKRKEYLDIIIHESDRLANMATKVLSLSKLESQTTVTQVSTYNLAEQIRLSFLLLENKWATKQIDFDINLDEIQICANEEMMQQVFVNVIDNAIKFTPDGGFVSLSLKIIDEKICFQIKDSGIGMDHDTLAYIFNKFYQADTSHQQEGNGLGLALVKKIVTLHKGEIQVDSSPENGTTITIFLPCYR